MRCSIPALRLRARSLGREVRHQRVSGVVPGIGHVFDCSPLHAESLARPRQISLSDDARVLFDYVTMVATAGCSIGHVGDLVVYYKLRGQTP
jgi:hypothetical protein